MIFSILSVLVPILVYAFVPKIIKANNKWRWILLVACLTFFVSWYLPSPLIYGDQTEFTTHFVGGGVFTGLLWLYVKLSTSWRSSWYVEAVTLIALVSTLGVANELFEVFLLVIGVNAQKMWHLTYFSG